MGKVYCLNTGFCPKKIHEQCPFNFGVLYNHLGDTFAIKASRQSDTYGEWKNRNAHFSERLRAGWWIECPRGRDIHFHCIGYIKHFKHDKTAEDNIRIIRAVRKARGNSDRSFSGSDFIK